MRKGGKYMLLFAAAVMLLSAGGCFWDNQEEFYPDSGTCDTLDVSFSTEITPLLSSHCWNCHSNQNANDFANGISLEDHQDVAERSASILGTVQHQQGFSPMPKNQPQLDSCSIFLLEAWVNQGSQDN